MTKYLMKYNKDHFQNFCRTPIDENSKFIALGMLLFVQDHYDKGRLPYTGILDTSMLR